MRASDLFTERLSPIIKEYRARINPSYSRRDMVPILATVFILLAIPLTVFVAVNSWGYRSKAAAPKKEEFLVSSKKTEVEVSSNTVLVKLDPTLVASARRQASNNKTGVASLDECAKQLGVVKIEPVVEARSNSNLSNPVYSWFKVTLPGEKGNIKFTPEEFSSSQIQPLDQKDKKRQKSQALKKLGKALISYRADKNVKEVEFNHVVHTMMIPNDTYADPGQVGVWSKGSWGQSYEDLWGLKKIEADKAWDVATGSAQVTVAIVDTGVDYNHPDIAANVWNNTGEIPGNGIDDDHNGYVDDYHGWDFTTCAEFDTTGTCAQQKVQGNNTSDDMGHGTHVAGTIGAVGNNGIGVVGVNWSVRLLPVKVFNKQGSGYSSEAASGIIYAADNGAKVINNSWGPSVRTPDDPLTESAIDYAYKKGSIVVFAAGNSNDDVSYYSPANDSEVVTVAATDSNDQKASFSNWGSKIDVAAPGVGILSLKSSTGTMCSSNVIVASNYCHVSGTSMAAPHVSGEAALILSKHPEFTNEEVKAIIKQSADDIGNPGVDQYYGAGRINVSKALQMTTPPPIAALAILKKVTGVIDITGTAKADGFHSYTLEFAPKDATSWKLITESSQPVKGGILFSNWDTSLVSDGSYTFRLTVKDNNGGTLAQDKKDIIVDNVSITDPREGQVFTKNSAEIDFIGTVQGTNFQSYKIEYSSDQKNWHNEGVTLANAGLQKIVSSKLGSLNPATAFNFASGRVTVKLTVSNTDGHVSIDQVGITIESFLNGWPKQLSCGIKSSPAIGDIDKDGSPEIVSASCDGKVYAWRSDGTLLPGWPVSISTDGISSPALADVDSDGYLEVFIGSSNGKMYGFRKDGTPQVGWPQQTSYTSGGTQYFGRILSSPAIGDIDSDGNLEIAVGVEAPQNQFYVWHKDGSLMAGFPKTVENRNGLTQLGWGTFAQTPALADLDKDGKLEIIIGNANANVYVWRSDGTNFPGWPQNVGDRRAYLSSPAIGDIDRDGSLEIVMGTENGYDGSSAKIYAWHNNGALVSGWPKSIIGGGSPVNAPVSLGDINKDGYLEIVVGAVDEHMYVWNYNGTPVSGWPVETPLIPSGRNRYAINSQAIIADVDGDNEMEIVTVGFGVDTDFSEYSALMAWKKDGSLLWIKDTQNGSLYSNPAIDDINRDGYSEIAVGDGDSNGGQMYIWQMPAQYSPKTVEWGMGFHDIRHTGFYGSAGKTGDLNSDGNVDIFDLSTLLTRWGTSDATADLNKNGSVDILDLPLLLSNWGT
jgi:subtilisin family serine protease